jgi:hypothetical protein
VGPTEDDEMQHGEDVPMSPLGVIVDPSSGERRGRGEDGEDAPTLRHIFPLFFLARPRAGTLPRFAPLVGPSGLFAYDT